MFRRLNIINLVGVYRFLIHEAEEGEKTHKTDGAIEDWNSLFGNLENKTYFLN